MRHAVMIVLCALLGAVCAFGQASTVTLQNQESSTFWFVVDPPELSDVTVGSRTFASRVGEYFAAGGEFSAFSRIGPEESSTLSGLSQGAHLLVGFFDVEAEQQLPVRAFSVQVDAGEGDRFYAVFSGPALLSVERSRGRIAALGQEAGTQAVETQPVAVAVEPVLPEEQPVAIAAEPVPAEEEPVAVAVEPVPAEEEPAAVAVEPVLPEEEPPTVAAEQPVEAPVLPEEEPAAVAAVPPVEAPVVAEAPPPQEPADLVQPSSPVASFAPDYDPVVFTRESATGFTVLPISQSRFWGEAGTRLESLDGVLGGGGVRLTLATEDGFSSQVSYFLYLFGERTLGRENAVTLEILPLAREGRGACVLWQRGEGATAAGAARPQPRLLGSVTTWGRTCVVEIDLGELPPEAIRALGENPSMDLCSCRYDGARSVFEEFYFTTVQLADLMGTGDGSVTR